MRGHARAVIIGGGIMGTSLLYHLAKEGWTDCVLVEKAELTSGSTWHAAGLVAHISSSLGLSQMTSYAARLFPKLEAETGQSVTWHPCGGLYIAYSQDELDWLNYIVNVNRGLGHPMGIIDPDEIRKIHPFYKLDGVIGALHTLDDGHVDPAGLCLAFAAGARKMGAEIVRFNRATGVKQLTSGGWEVATELGNIVCEHVINAGGTYARQIGQWVGLDLPITNTTHHYLVTETIPEFLSLTKELPVLRDASAFSGYARMEQKSLLIGIYEKSNPNTVWDDGTPWEAVNELFEPHLDRIGHYLQIAMERMPIFEKAGIKRIVHGAIPNPPDGNMLLGPAPGLKNYWCCCGSQIGIAWGPGAGKYLAQWMVHGAADISMRDVDPRRYGSFADRKYVIEKSREDYVLHRVVPFPGFNRLAGRPKKKSALYERLKEAGAIFEEVYGWEQPRWFAPSGVPRKDQYAFKRPGWFDIVAAECRSVQNQVGVIDMTAFGKIELSGKDSQSFLSRLIANHVPQRIGGIALTHLLNRKGTIEAEIVVTRLGEENFYITFAAFFEHRVLDWLAAHRNAAEQVEWKSVSKEYGCLGLNGPRARDVLRKVTQSPLDNASFPWLSQRNIDIGGLPVRALRVSYAGELGWEIHAPFAQLPGIYDAIWDAGQPFGIGHFGSFAISSMRLEKAFHASSELTNEVTLPEADVTRFLKLNKNDFVGREATIASMARPLRWKCALLDVDARDADCWGGETVYGKEQAVGFVTSGSYGHRVKKSLAFAYVNLESSEPGSSLEIDILGERRGARVLAGPAYDPTNALPRADI